MPLRSSSDYRLSCTSWPTFAVGWAGRPVVAVLQKPQVEISAEVSSLRQEQKTFLGEEPLQTGTGLRQTARIACV